MAHAPPSKKDIYYYTVTWLGCGFTCGRLKIDYSIVIPFKFYLLNTWLTLEGSTFEHVFIR